MKKLLYILPLFLSTTLFFAQEIEVVPNNTIATQPNSLEDKIKLNLYFDNRMDYSNSINRNIPNDLNDFDLSFSRFYLKSSFNDKIDVSMRYTLKKSPAQANGLEFAFMTVHLSDNWNITAGKLIMNWGSFEIDYNGADLYIYTLVMTSIENYAPGVNIQYKWNNQKFTMQFANPGPQFVEPDTKDMALGYLLMWDGALFKSRLKTKYGYGIIQHSDKKYYNWITLGNHIDFKNAMLEVDWLRGEHDLYLSANDLERSHVRDNSIALTSKYYLHKWNPFVKVTYNTRDNLSNPGKQRTIGTQIAAEYYPFETPRTKDFRVFASYNFESNRFDGMEVPSFKNSKHELLCGIRWLIPLVQKN